MADLDADRVKGSINIRIDDDLGKALGDEWKRTKVEARCHVTFSDLLRTLLIAGLEHRRNSRG